MKRLVAIAFFSLPTPGFAQTQQPFNPPTGFSLYSNFAHNGKTLDGTTGPDANWSVMVSALPGSIGAFTAPVETAPGQWSSKAAWGEVDVNATTQPQTITISQNGAGHACIGPNGGVSEYDIDIAPDRAALNTAVAPTKKDFPRLAALTSLTLAGTVKINMARPAAGVAPCLINHAGANISAEFVDNAVQPPQMLWYGINITRVCAPGPGGAADLAYQRCMANRPQLSWFWNGKHADGLTNYGVGEPLQTFGATPVSGNAPARFSFDLLPHIDALITSGHAGIDPNLQDWRLAATNYGQSLWGNTTLSTTWQGFVPTWTLAR